MECLQSLTPNVLGSVFLQLFTCGRVNLDAVYFGLGALSEHHHEQTGAAADIEHRGIVWYFGREPGAEDTGVGTDFHRALILMDNELFKLEVGVGHFE